VLTIAGAVAVAACVAGSAAPVRSPSGDAVAFTQHSSAVAIRPAHIILPIPPQQQISYTVGFANAQKLGSSVLLGEPTPATADLDITLFQTFELGIGSDCDSTTGPECTTIVYSTADLNYKGHPELPPLTATVLAYGFVPVTVTLQLIAEPSNCPAPTSADAAHTVKAGICLLTIQHGLYPAGQESTATARLTVHVSSVKVNGTSLSVGPHCQAASAGLEAVGSSSGTVATVPPGQYVIALGGTLTGTVAIPAFTGCVAPSGENLNPLLTSAVSGAGNDVQLTQGDLCLVGSGCAPDPPAASRDHGQALVYQFGNSSGISCTSAAHATAITGPAGTIGTIGAVSSFSLSGCTLALNGDACTATGRGLPWPVDAVSYDPVARQATGTIGDANTAVDIAFSCTANGKPDCSVELNSNVQTTDGAGAVDVVYDYRSRTLTDFAAALSPVSSTCPGFTMNPDPNLADQDELFLPSYVVNR
jgi:hypothetical protein